MRCVYRGYFKTVLGISRTETCILYGRQKLLGYLRTILSRRGRLAALRDLAAPRGVS